MYIDLSSGLGFCISCQQARFTALLRFLLTLLGKVSSRVRLKELKPFYLPVIHSLVLGVNVHCAATGVDLWPDQLQG